MKNVYSKLLVSFFIFVSFLYADTKIEHLNVFKGVKQELIKGYNAQSDVSVPLPQRWKVNSAMLHIEFIPSKALVSQRSVLTLYFNGVALYQQKLNTGIDIYSANIKVPYVLLSDYNDIKIIASQHYCMNCCEKENAPELWTEILWKDSYIKLNYKPKLIHNNLTYLKNYILDDKQYNPLNFGILLQNQDDDFITFGAKIAGFLGNIIKYRKIYVNSVKNIFSNQDVFVIGTKNFVKRILKLKGDIPNIFVLQNPMFPSKGIVVLTAETKAELKQIINSFISIKKSTLVGTTLNITKFKKPKINAYETPSLIPFDKKISFYDLGYKDFKYYNPGYKYSVYFNIPTDTYLYSKSKMHLHLAYNYGSGARDDSVINIFLNGKFITQLPVKKHYGTILEENDINIPVYMLSPGKNKITVQYGLIPTGKGFCVEPNFNELQGTVFTQKSYIKLPNLPHWIQMPYMEYFTTQAYPFSKYPDMKSTQFFISSKNKKLLSSLYTLCAYMGEKTRVPFYSLKVVSDENLIDKDRNIIALGNNFPEKFYKNLPLSVNNGNIELKYSLFSKIKNLIKSKVLHLEQKENLQMILDLKDNLEDETILTMGQSPYKEDKTVFLINSKNPDNIFSMVKKLYIPKYLSKIKGDFVVFDKDTNNIYYASLAKKYYIGHLPLFEYILFKLGYSFNMLLIYSVLIIFILAVIIKLLLDIREKRLKK